LKNLDLCAIPIGVLLSQSQNAANNLPSHILSCIPRFSPLFYLEVTKKRLKILSELHRKEQLNKVTEERLWSEINLNLEKDLEKRNKIIIPNLALISRIPPKSQPSNERDTIAFTCGHFFPRRDFVDSILPDLVKRLESFPVPLPLTSKILISDYFKNQTDHACPVCLFGGLRVEFLKNFNDLTIPIWSL